MMQKREYMSQKQSASKWIDTKSSTRGCYLNLSSSYNFCLYMERRAWQQITRYEKIRIFSPEVLRASAVLQARQLDKF